MQIAAKSIVKIVVKKGIRVNAMKEIKGKPRGTTLS